MRRQHQHRSSRAIQQLRSAIKRIQRIRIDHHGHRRLRHQRPHNVASFPRCRKPRPDATTVIPFNRRLQLLPQASPAQPRPRLPLQRHHHQLRRNPRHHVQHGLRNCSRHQPRARPQRGQRRHRRRSRLAVASANHQHMTEPALVRSSRRAASPQSPSTSLSNSVHLDRHRLHPASRSPQPPLAQSAPRQMTKHVRQLRCRERHHRIRAKRPLARVCAIESASHPLGRSTATTGTVNQFTISRAAAANPRSGGLKPRSHHGIDQQLRPLEGASRSSASSSSSLNSSTSGASHERASADAASPFTSSIFPKQHHPHRQPYPSQHTRRHQLHRHRCSPCRKARRPASPADTARGRTTPPLRLRPPSELPAEPQTPSPSAGPPRPISAAVRTLIPPFYPNSHSSQAALPAIRQAVSNRHLIKTRE